jgi:hypothetical protein
MALTTHFAKVQFRLKQIVSAPEEDKDVSIESKILSQKRKIYQKSFF